MKEIHEFRIFKDNYHLLPVNDAKFNGAAYILKISPNDPLFQNVGELYNRFKKENRAFFSFWSIKRQYTKEELNDAILFNFKIKTGFEPTGEECGTIYDEAIACEICGANRKQVGPLRLKKGSIPKKDIARTIAGEVIVSDKFVKLVKSRDLKGIMLEPVVFKNGISNHYQLTASSELELTNNTTAGLNMFDFGEEGQAMEFDIPGGYTIKFEKEIYKCPNGDTIGLNLLSEAYVFNSKSIGRYDFFASRQKIGVKRGLLRPEPLYFCSQNFRKMVEEENLTGFEFEIAHIDSDGE